MELQPVTGPVLSQEFSIYTDLSGFPLTECPAYLDVAVGAVCVAGSATIQVFDTKCRFTPDSVLTLIPWQLASIREISDDFRITFFRVSKEMFTDSLSTLWRLTPEFYFYSHKHFISEPVEGVTRRFLNYCDLLASRVLNAPPACRRESIMQLLRVFYWDVYAVYVNNPFAGHVRYTRKEELAFRFMRMVIEERSPNLDVPHYAEKLGVSAKYLTNLIRSISGQSARDWIVYYTIFEIKALLRESTIDLKTIVARVNFPDQSSLSRFFRHYTGMTPSQYRESIHF